MGTFLEGLWDHEGYADGRLPDGRLAEGVWSSATRELSGFVATCGCGWRGRVDQWRGEHATPLLVRQSSRRRGELGLELRWLGTQADRLEDPDALRAVSRAVDHAQRLVADLQRDLERQALEREADHER
jgi:hypothetical protein